MKTIWKYPIPIGDRFALSLPCNASVLCVQMQEMHMEVARPCIWVLIPDTGEPHSDRYFRIIGTGQLFEVGDDYRYLGTVQAPPFVWHLFEEKTTIALKEREPCERKKCELTKEEYDNLYRGTFSGIDDLKVKP
jgi:hypothetical protein